MKQRNIKISLISFIVVILIIIITQSCGNHNAFCVKTISGEGEDTTYSIINRRSNATVYEGGNNPIQLDSIIDGNYIFIENIVTEECSDRIIVCDPVQQLVLVAYNLGWCFGFEEDDWQQLIKGVDKEYSIKRLDLKNKEIYIQFFNKDILSLKINEVYNY